MGKDKLEEGYYVAQIQGSVNGMTLIHVREDGSVKCMGYEKNIAGDVREIFCGPFRLSEAIQKLS